ncbi:MAG: AgmX/PglI C-terminal domain-containing protein [Myxococcota bacterium]|nr:AgmX/PglI C-terminal domain-containing protein [Myxococcota bacterium]
MAESRATKILRIGLIQNGKIVEERLLRRRESVTIGQSPRNTFVLSAAAGLPKAYTLFDLKAQTYHLNFRSGMNGKVSVDDDVLDFRGLREQKLARKKGDVYTVKLSERSRGKVVIGEVTVLFQFVTPPPPPTKLQLPASLKGSVTQRLDWPFVCCLLGSFAVQVFSLAFIMTQDYPEEPRGLETLPDRFVKVLVEKKPVKPPPPKKMDDDGEEKEKDKTKEKVEKKPEPKPKPKPTVEQPPPKDETPEQRARAKAKRLRKMQKEVANKTILKFVGTEGGEGPGSILNTLRDGATDVQIAEAFEGTSGLMVANKQGISRDRRIGSTKGKVTGIDSGSLKGKRRKVSSGKKGREQSIKGSVKIKKPSEAIGMGVLDPSAIGRVVGRRKGAIKSCYEKQLKRNPKLRGTVKVQFTILESGRVDRVKVLQDTTGDQAVGRCIKQKMRRWRFPKPDGGSVTVSFPFVFTPSS